MQVITLAQVKAQLGITDTSQDAAITAKLPIIDAKVKQITNHKWDYRFAADMVSGSNELTAYALFKGRDNYPSGIKNNVIVRDVTDDLEIGMLVEGTNIPTGAYITNFYKTGSTDNYYSSIDTVVIELSENATDDGAGVTITGGISIAYHDVIAKGVWYLIGQTSTTIADNTWTSRNVGPLSVSKSEMAAKVEGLGGMPAWFSQQFPRWIG